MNSAPDDSFDIILMAGHIWTYAKERGLICEKKHRTMPGNVYYSAIINVYISAVVILNSETEC